MQAIYVSYLISSGSLTMLVTTDPRACLLWAVVAGGSSGQGAYATTRFSNLTAANRKSYLLYKNPTLGMTDPYFRELSILSYFQTKLFLPKSHKRAKHLGRLIQGQRHYSRYEFDC